MSPDDRSTNVMRTLAFIVATTLLVSGCSIKRIAINKLGNSLAESGTTYAADDDPELVGAAIPFSLKLIEGLLSASPKHRGLLFAAASGFTQYGYAYVQMEADQLDDVDIARATAGRARARRLYVRARDYGLRGLEARHKNFAVAFRADPRTAVRPMTKADVPMLYWTAAAWGALVAISKENPETVADQPLVEALIDRALELDEGFDYGAIHSFLISYEPARQGGEGDPYERSRQHFDRVVTLTAGQLASPLVSYAEAVALAREDRAGFERLLRDALAIDPDARPEWRLSNLIMQRRARWLLSRVDQLFMGSAPERPAHLSFVVPLGSTLGVER